MLQYTSCIDIYRPECYAVSIFITSRNVSAAEFYMKTAQKISFFPYQINSKAIRLAWRLNGKESACQCRRCGLDPWSRKLPCAMEQLSPCATSTEPVLSSPGAAATEAWALRACAQHQEKPLQWQAQALHLESSRHSPQLKPVKATKTQDSHK